MIRGSNNPFDRDLLQWPATFSRAGRIDRNPSWTVPKRAPYPDCHLGAIGESPSRPAHRQSPYRLHGADFCRRWTDATRRHGCTRQPLSPRRLEQKLGSSSQFLLLCVGRNHDSRFRMRTISKVEHCSNTIARTTQVARAIFVKYCRGLGFRRTTLA